MSSSDFKYLYGPVPSRRLRRSLGLDLVPFKTCTYDCIYCQLGRTTNKTIERQDFFPVVDILAELKNKLATGDNPDYISVAGSGEPTLHSGIGELIGKIKELTKIPVAVLTNGSLLYLPDVRTALAKADLVIPSLDAGDETLFRYVNRPHPDIVFEDMVNGMIEFTRHFPGKVWLEVFLLSGITGMIAEARKIAAYAKQIGAQRVQLNTVSRPSAEDFACAVEAGQLKKFAKLFSPPADIIADNETVYASISIAKDIAGDDIVNLLARRPCALTGVCSGLGLHPHDAVKKLKKLIDEKRITTLRTSHDVFYTIAEKF